MGSEMCIRDRTFELLQTIGVDFAQGYGLSQPRLITEETSLRSALAA